MKMAENLLEIAREDLEAARCLYERELFPQAIFYLQQSVEKAAKSFGLMTGIINEDELKGRKGIGHNPLKINEKAVLRLKTRLEKINKAIGKIPELTGLFKGVDLNGLSEKTDTALKLFGELEENKRELIFISKEEIEECIDEINKIESKINEANEILSTLSFSEEEFDRSKQHIMEFFDTISRYNPQMVEEIRKEVDNIVTPELIEKILDLFLSIFIPMTYSLLYLSIITLPHAVPARYPDEDFNPLEVYTKDLPIVQSFNELCEIIEETLFKMENLLEIIGRKGDSYALHREIPC